MDRRRFLTLSSLATAALIAEAKKPFIFDVGANLWRKDSGEWLRIEIYDASGKLIKANYHLLDNRCTYVDAPPGYEEGFSLTREIYRSGAHLVIGPHRA